MPTPAPPSIHRLNMVNISKEPVTQFFESLGNTCICGGDFNCKRTHWGFRLTKPNGRKWYVLSRKLNYSLSIKGPTY